MTERQEMEAAIEAILFAATEPVSEKKVLEVFDEKEREAAAEALQAVIAAYREKPEKGVMIDEVAGGLRLVTRPDLYGYLRRFFEVSGTNKLTMAALETLAIVAYRQPVTGPEIQELRGVNVSGVLKTLLERRLVRISGRKEVVGKPFLYATTREFLQHFGLRSLKELPPLEQFEELLGGESEAATGEGGEDYEEEVLREVAAVEERDDEESAEEAAPAEEAEESAKEDAPTEEAEESAKEDAPTEEAEESAEEAAPDEGAEESAEEATPAEEAGESVEEDASEETAPDEESSDEEAAVDAAVEDEPIVTEPVVTEPVATESEVEGDEPAVQDEAQEPSAAVEAGADDPAMVGRDGA